MNRHHFILVATVMACGRAEAATNPLESGLLKCARETEQTARLACFDALVTTIPTVKANEFGLTAQIERKRQPLAAPVSAPESATESAPENTTLPGKIVALRLAPRGEIIFTLDNQQVWMQTEVEPGKRFSLGDAVQIEHGAMGSYWLAADKARKTRVKRIS